MSKKSTGPVLAGGKPAPARPNFIWMFVIWAVITFLIFRNTNNNTKPVNQPTAAQLYSQLVHENKILHEADAAQTFNQYKGALNDELKAHKITPQQELAQEMQGAILVADAQLRGAEKTGIYNKYYLAYVTLQNYERHDSINPAWSQNTLEIAGPGVVSRSWTGHQLYETVVQKLSAQNRKSLVWGFIPGFALTNFLVHLTGAIPAFSYWFAPLLLAVIVRGIVWPLTQRQLLYSRQMQQLIPRTKEIKAQYPNDMQTQQMKTMELYKEYGINPMAGCWPLFIQMPFFWAIYECMLRYQFQFQKGTFLWINPHISALTHGFTAPNLGQQDDILIIIYGLTMMTTQWLMPIGDPTQAKQQRIMGTVISIAIPGFMFFGAFPVASAFVLYWTFTNVIATTQSLIVYRMPVPPLEKVQTAFGGQIVGTKTRKPGFMERMNEELAKKVANSSAPVPSDGGASGNKPSIWDKLNENAKRQLEEQEQRKTSTKNGSADLNKNGSTTGNGSANSSKNGQSKQSKPKRRTPK